LLLSLLGLEVWMWIHFTSGLCFDFRLLILILFFLRATKPGAARQPLTFLASPRKVSKRRRPQVRSPYGVPGVVRHKSGGETNSLRSDKFPLFIRFAPDATGCSQAGIPDWLAAHRQGGGGGSMAVVLRDVWQGKASNPWRGAASQFGRSAWSQPVMRCEKWKKRGNLSERSEFVSPPIFCFAAPGSPKDLDPAVAFLLLTFLGETRKVSSCRATPGEGLIEERTA
jgi:hypothetical protein